MLRKSPINYLVAFAFVLLAWAFGVIWGASYLGDSVSFQNVTPEDFQWMYRVVMSVLAVQTMAVIALWFVHGSRDNTSTQLVGAKRVWTAYWLVEFVLSLGAVVALAVIYLGELFEPMHYGVMFLTTALQTWVVFWVATVLCSPPIVQFVAWGKR